MLVIRFRRHTWLLAALIAVTSIEVCGTAYSQEFKNSIVSTEFDFITKDDPSTFSELDFTGTMRAEMPSKTSDELFGTAHVFKVTFTDNTSLSIFVDTAIGVVDSAKKEAMRFVHPLGRLPTALRRGVNRLCVHKGGEKLTAFSDIGLIVMYSDNASVRIKNHDLEETIFHESVHAAWDKKHAMSKDWIRAQNLDGQFATVYAKSKPQREDLAESALFAYTIIHHPERLPKKTREDLRSRIPARIMFVANLLPADKPIHYKIPNNDAKKD